MQPYWIDLMKERKKDCTHVDYNLLEPFTIKNNVHQYCAGLKINGAPVQPQSHNIGVYDNKW